MNGLETERQEMGASRTEVFVLGTSHSVASAEMRQRLYVELDDLYETLVRLVDRGVLAGAVPLVTCGRLEVYVATPHPESALLRLRQLLARRTGVAPEEIEAHSYVHRGRDAVAHLFRVAAGLDSVVHGEAQIIGQVRDALEHPSTRRTAGPLLLRLFQNALAAGKRVRTETEIGRGAVSLAGAALALLERQAGSLAPLSALVLGAGDTGRLVARLLRKEGVGRLTVANRTPAKAEAVARELGATAVPLEDLPALIADADVIVGAVGERDDLVHPALVADALRASGARTRWFVDLAHPRNFHPDLATLPGVRLMDLEHVFAGVEAARAARAAQLPRAEALVAEDAEAFMRWLRSRESVAVLRAVREQVLELAQAEAERAARGRTEQEREELHRLARSLAKAVLHHPTLALREADPTGTEGRRLLETATCLFGLDPARLGSAEGA
jgi:glutamyl-tRNA reductase